MNFDIIHKQTKGILMGTGRLYLKSFPISVRWEISLNTKSFKNEIQKEVVDTLQT